MKPYRFRLETVLKLRQQQEEIKKRRVGELVSVINREQQKALALAEAVKAQENDLKLNLQGNVDTGWIGYYQRFAAGIQQGINEHVRKVTEIQPQLTTAREELAEAAKQTKILEKLKARQQERYQKELRKKENRESDEIGSTMVQRNTVAQG